MGGGGGTGFTACTHRSENVPLSGDVYTAASSAGAGTPGAKTLSNGVGSLQAQKPTVDVGRS